MRIAHIGLASFYTEGMTYQDNQLSEQNVRDGHQVLYIANASKYENGKIVRTAYEDRVLDTGVRLIRVPNSWILNRFISDKIRKAKGIYRLLSDFQPDVILSHDLCYWSVLDVIRYKKEHPEVKLYADTHTGAYNSGMNWLSLNILHRIFYRYLVQRALPYLDKYFYIGHEEKLFNMNVYNVPESILEFYPLGGSLFSEDEYMTKRKCRRSELQLCSDDILFVHSGKMSALKRTPELLRAFAEVSELKAKLVVIGAIPPEMENEITPLLNQDERVVYLGWKSGAELLEYLCACDLYCQPGSGSATMQNAVCCGCPVLSYPHEYYLNDFDYGFFLWAKTKDDMVAIFRNLVDNPEQLQTLKQNAWKCATELLDYKQLATRLYE